MILLSITRLPGTKLEGALLTNELQYYHLPLRKVNVQQQWHQKKEINRAKKYRVKAVSFVKENLEIIQHSCPTSNQMSKFPMESVFPQ